MEKAMPKIMLPRSAQELSLAEKISAALETLRFLREGSAERRAEEERVEREFGFKLPRRPAFSELYSLLVRSENLTESRRAEVLARVQRDQELRGDFRALARHYEIDVESLLSD